MPIVRADMKEYGLMYIDYIGENVTQGLWLEGNQIFLNPSITQDVGFR